MQTLIRAAALRRVDRQATHMDARQQTAAEGDETGTDMPVLPFVLQKTLSPQTQQHLRRQGTFRAEKP